MNASDYQKEAARTLISDPGEFTSQEMMTIWGAVGLAGEAGEVAELVKKGIFHRHGLEREKLAKELGDVAWYLASICTVQGIDLGEVMQANIDKLKTRYPDGFTTVDSMKRVDVESDFDICECGHSRADHSKNSDGDTACYHKNDMGHYDTCTEFTLRATVAHDEPATICHCGHDGYIHDEDGVCLHWDKVHYCSCNKYTPIPAHLRSDTQNPQDK